MVVECEELLSGFRKQHSTARGSVGWFCLLAYLLPAAFDRRGSNMSRRMYPNVVGVVGVGRIRQQCVHNPRTDTAEATHETTRGPCQLQQAVKAFDIDHRVNKL